MRGADADATAREPARTSTRESPSASPSRARHVQMAEMNGIEGAAQQADCHQLRDDSTDRGHLTPHRFEQRRQALARDGRDRVERDLLFLQVLLKPLRAARGRRARRSCSRRRSEACRQGLRPCQVAGAGKQLQFAADDVEILDRVAAAGRRDVDHVHQDLGSFQVREELRAQAVSLVRAFDQARDVGHDERPVIAQLHDAEVRRQRRERVVGDLRPRRRKCAKSACSCRRWGSRPVRRRPAASAAAAACGSRRAVPAQCRRGARLVDGREAELPRPPWPPRATSTRSPTAVRSASGIRSSALLLVDDRAGRHLEHEVVAAEAGAVRRPCRAGRARP